MRPEKIWVVWLVVEVPLIYIFHCAFMPACNDIIYTKWKVICREGIHASITCLFHTIMFIVHYNIVSTKMLAKCKKIEKDKYGVSCTIYDAVSIGGYISDIMWWYNDVIEHALCHTFCNERSSNETNAHENNSNKIWALYFSNHIINSAACISTRIRK